jgi:hypothetical protein
LSSPATQTVASADARASQSTRPQFSLKVIFAATTWVAAIAGLAVSQFAGWTMCAVGLSVVCLNCSGRLTACQRRPGQSWCFRAAWLLLGLSLFLPAMKGCNGTTIRGWEAAKTCGAIVLDPPDSRSQWSGHALFCLCSVANVLLAVSPLFLWRLRQGKGTFYGLLLVTAVPAMWCFGDPVQVLIGYYVWCAGGLIILCAFRLRWAMLPLVLVALLLVCFARLADQSDVAAHPAAVSATTTRSSS